MSFKNDMNMTVTEKTYTEPIEQDTCTCPDPESILEWIEWCIEVGRRMGKPYLSRQAFKWKEY
jgi:hypothetical protein